jgi:hypothetical protein
MIRLLLATLVAALFGVLSASEAAPQNDGLPLVRADFPVCVTVKPPPLRAPKRDVFKPQVSEMS